MVWPICFPRVQDSHTWAGRSAGRIFESAVTMHPSMHILTHIRFVHLGWLHDMILPYDISCPLEMPVGFLIHFSLFHDRKCMHLYSTYYFRALGFRSCRFQSDSGTQEIPGNDAAGPVPSPRVSFTDAGQISGSTRIYHPQKKNIPENIYLVSYFHHMRFWTCTVFHIFAFFLKDGFFFIFSFLRDMMDFF